MPTTKISILSLVAAGFLLAAGTPAQETPAANSTSTPPAAAKPATAAKPAQTPAAKSGTAATKTAPAPLTLTTPKQKVSYALGMGLGKNLKRDSVEVDPAIILRGLKDALAGNKLLLTDDEAKASIVALNNELRAKAEAKAKATALENKMKGDTFLAENKKKEGVVTLPSGLQYKILTAGAGPKPAADDVVNCNYRGTLIDNTEFDSSYKRGQPLKIPVGGVIKGWTEALQLMPVGSKWQLFIPSDLAYGERAPATIGPNATLIFEVDLISIEPKPAKEPAKETPSQPQAGQPQQAQPPKDQPKEAPKEQPKEQPKDQAPPTSNPSKP